MTGQELSDIKIGNLRFSAQENCLYCKGKPVSLSKTELKMLTYMLKEPKKAFSREEILEGVWGFDTEVETRVTDETLRRIRRKLSLAGSNVSIGTIWGFGYRISIAEDKSEAHKIPYFDYCMVVNDFTFFAFAGILNIVLPSHFVSEAENALEYEMDYQHYISNSNDESEDDSSDYYEEDSNEESTLQKSLKAVIRIRISPRIFTILM